MNSQQAMTELENSSAAINAAEFANYVQSFAKARAIPCIVDTLGGGYFRVAFGQQGPDSVLKILKAS